jgi:hypothetical protein
MAGLLLILMVLIIDIPSAAIIDAVYT